jgi:hypothetical protein
MSEPATVPLHDLYELDETAWLEQMSELVAEKRFNKLDHRNLSEYLSDMARRDKREVRTRLIILMQHLLKWHYQPRKRTTSWRNTIREQRSELKFDSKSGSLRRYADDVLAEAYAEAVERAADESHLSPTKFPTDLPWTFDQLLNQKLDAK